MIKSINSKITILIVVAMLLLAHSYVAFADTEIVDGGTSGGLTWTLDSEGLLLITGSGEMYDTNGYGLGTWANNTSIKSVVIEEGPTKVTDMAFQGCTNIESVTLPNSIKYIEQKAFCDCTSLTSINIPQNVSSIYPGTGDGYYNGSFYGCSNLTAINVDNDNPYYSSVDGVLYYANTSTLVKCPEGKVGSVEIPESVGTIKAGAFSNCTKLTDIDFNDSLTTIEGWAFRGCTGITSIDFPDSVQNVGSGLFTSCTGLVDVTVPDGIKNLNNSFFNGCSNLKSVALGNNLTTISFEAFAGCKSLKSIDIPAGVVSIDADAFPMCNSLESINVAESNSKYSSINGMLCDKRGSTLIFCPQGVNGKLIIPETITKIKTGAFNSYSHYDGNNDFNRSITSIQIPDTVTSLEDSTFNSLTNLKSINIPESITIIPNGLFNGCSSLESIDLPLNITSIGDNAFSGCKSLTSIDIPNSVQTIGKSAFSNCSSIKKIIIPDGVSKLENYTFYGCNNLATVIIPGSVESFGNSYTFDNTSSGHKIDLYTVPESYAADWFTRYFGSSYVHYLCDPAAAPNNEYLGFTSSSIAMKTASTISLDEYLITSFDIAECKVALSNEDLFMYDSGEIANLGAGECEITVSNGDCSATATLVAQDDTIESVNSLSFVQQTISLKKGTATVNPIILNPQNANVLDVVWSSSNEDVVKVDDGLINAVGVGVATVTASSKHNDSVKCDCIVNVSVPLEELILVDSETISIEKGKSRSLKYYKYPADATDFCGAFSSSDKNIVEIDDSGKMTAKNFGSVVITVSSGNITKTINVVVKRALTGISLNKQSAQIKANESLQLNVKYEPEDTTERDVVWTSNKESVATVDENGLVTAHGKGIATITAASGEYTAKCTIVCPNVPMTGISIEDKTIGYGQSYSPEITYIPSTTTDDKTVTWQSSDESVFTVSDDGAVTPTGLGTATLTATVGEFTATSEITVTKGVPEFTLPENLTANCDQKLSEITLPEGFSWVDDTKSVGGAGSTIADAIYTPADQENFSIVSGLLVTITVNHKYAEAWSSDGTEHWHECICGEKDSESEHTYGDWTVTTEPTCTEKGEKEHVCSVCGYVEKAEVEEIGHDYYADYTIDKQPTCTGTGSKSIHCRTCGDIKPNSEKTIEALGHVYAETVIEPTCSQKGHTLHVCGRCGDSYTDTETSAKDHSFGDWVTDTDSTCTTEGIQHRECSECGYIETKGINKKEHSFSTEYTVDKEATCTTDGSKSYHCTVDGCTATTGSEVIPAAGHQYSEWTIEKAATCEEEGVSEHECSVCHTKETLVLPATDHDWMTKAIVDTEPTCTEAGSKSIHCKACDAVKEGTVETIPALGHSYGSWETTKEPTCTEPGQKERICSTCNDRQTAEIAASEHKWVDKATVDKDPTCTEAGSKSIHCKVCGSTKEGTEEAIPAKGHSYGSWETTKEPTCTETGLESRKCSNCDEEETNTIPANDHSWLSTHTVDKEATCTESGEKSIHCKVCDAVKEDSKVTIEPLGHEYTEAVVEPTCSQNGYTLYVCARCGDRYTDNETDATGHTFGDWVTDTDSTCTTEGIQHRECSECGYIETKGINKKEHSFSTEYTLDKEATCTTDGSKSYHCTVDGCTATTGSEVIPAAGHQYTEWKETKKPTCEDSGDAERLCPVCGVKETVHFEARGHAWMNNPTVDKYPTCSEEGTESIHCAVCDAVKPGTEETISKAAHTWDSGKITTAPTCTKEGVKTVECSVCHEEKTEKIPAAGHKWNTTYTTDKAATRTTNGSRSIHCSVCNETKPGSSVVIPKLEQTDLPAVKIVKPVAAKKAATIKWKKVSKANQKKIASIQIQYSLDKTFKTGVKTVTAKKTAVSKIIKKLKSKKTYYVRIRAYKKSGSVFHISKWSAVKKVKAK